MAWEIASAHVFIELAKNDMHQWMINLPDQDLAYLPECKEHFEDYVRAGLGPDGINPHGIKKVLRNWEGVSAGWSRKRFEAQIQARNWLQLCAVDRAKGNLQWLESISWNVCDVNRGIVQINLDEE